MLEDKTEGYNKLHEDFDTMSRELRVAREELNTASQAIEELTEENSELYV